MRKSWLGMLLLNYLGFCACQGNTCVVGVFGESVSIPCMYNGQENLTSLNISFQWRRGFEVVYKAVWTRGHEESVIVNLSGRSTVSSLAQTGNFTLELSDISFSDAQNYSLYLKLPDSEANVLICTVCLSVADFVKSISSSGFIWILSLILCVLVTVLVSIALCCQKKWDRDRRTEHEDHSGCEETEMIMLDMDVMDGLLNKDRSDA